ncbi:biopolymer transporter ExbD [Luteolibacter pohnpeiensis]|uniref:Biopolymer transporter ExbD n=1 Tax=Luteolibacter pohnpeiensis TaxID=454153 RepID=A0A934VV58_9BACT|nr:biopolymer transporter ExbD [Luteolibacter pohnpeiensis]MBK1881840.1 biopolymer transporter ExbD [Luteolibacter pohnpeiensis]
MRKKGRARHKKSSEVHLGFQIAPMVDVVFVILLYFMVAAANVQTENEHITKLPGTVPTDTETLMPDEISIRIEDDGQVYLNDDPLDSPESKNLPELAGTLYQLHESSVASQSDVLVTIYANDLARYTRVVDVLDALSRAKISSVTFQAGSAE